MRPILPHFVPAWEEVRASPVAQMVKNPPAKGSPGLNPWVGKIPGKRAWQPTPVFLPGESPWTEKPGGLQSMGSQRVRHDWVTKHAQEEGMVERKEDPWTGLASESYSRFVTEHKCLTRANYLHIKSGAKWGETLDQGRIFLMLVIYWIA